MASKKPKAPQKRLTQKGLGALAGMKAPKPKKKATPKRKKPPKAQPPTRRREAESPGYTKGDKEAFQHAFAGVRPLDAPAPGATRPKRKPKPAPRRDVAKAAIEAAEESARARLDQLVGGGLSFSIERDGARVMGRRNGAPVRTMRMLGDGELVPEATLDLHGLNQVEAKKALRQFVRDEHRRGRRTLAIVHGKGKHSEGGIGVLRGTVVQVLTKGGAAPLVEAFATAPTRFGGEGAIIVRLSTK